MQPDGLVKGSAMLSGSMTISETHMMRARRRAGMMAGDQDKCLLEVFDIFILRPLVIPTRPLFH